MTGELNSQAEHGSGDGTTAVVTQWCQHERWLHAVVLARLRTTDGVSEVLQEVYMALHQSGRVPTEPSALARWLYRVAVRQALLYRRRLHRQRRRELFYARQRHVGHDGGSEAEPLDRLLADERRKLVWQAVARLPSAEAEILLLKYSEDWTYQQLAERLGIGVEAVKARLHRARVKLRCLLDGKF